MTVCKYGSQYAAFYHGALIATGCSFAAAIASGMRAIVLIIR